MELKLHFFCDAKLLSVDFFIVCLVSKAQALHKVIIISRNGNIPATLQRKWIIA